MLPSKTAPRVLDLSGSAPDLVPEWVPWTMEALREAGLATETYLWSDDNLSTSRFLSEMRTRDIETMRSYRNYGRVGCFKGFDESSFAFNTGARSADYHRQFEVMRTLVGSGIDVYAYVTLTTPTTDGMTGKLSRFFDELQLVHENLPLRTVPLEIRAFTPVRKRMTPQRRQALENQWLAVAAWTEELERRFEHRIRRLKIHDVPLD